MIGLFRPAQRFLQGSVPLHGCALALLVAATLGSSPSHADPGDFGAMPGLWKMVLTPLHDGHPGKPTIQWHCIDEGADPWTAFAGFLVPDLASCQRGQAHRSSTALAWTLTCAGNPPSSGHGHVDFDSAEHYTAGVELQDRGEVIRVEGRRYAACTSPSD